MTTLTTANDLCNVIANRRPDLEEHGVVLSPRICRDAMHSLGLRSYEDLTSDDLDRIVAAILIGQTDGNECPWCGEEAHHGSCDDDGRPDPLPCDCGVSRPDRATAPDGGHAADCASREVRS